MRVPGIVGFRANARIPQYLIALGAAIAVVLLGEIGFLLAIGSPLVFEGTFVVGVVTSAPFVVGIVAGGYWLRTAGLSPDRYPRVAGWCLAGLVVFLSINIALVAVMPIESWEIVVSWLRWAIALGAGTGLLVGCLEARAIEGALTAERATLRAEYLESQRDYLDYLNSLLRHEVLNTSSIITGYARLLRDEEPELTDHGRRWTEVIIDESEAMSTVIDDVRVLLQTADGEYQLEPVNASRILGDEVRKLNHKYGPVDVEASIPEDVFVRADGLLARVFGNLLSNAVEHNDSDAPRVDIGVDSGPETVRIEIADNGPGIPEAQLDSLFERGENRGSTHGLGLYLVHRLVARYDGSIEVAETGPDGTTFTIELPSASADRERTDQDRSDRADRSPRDPVRTGL